MGRDHRTHPTVLGTPVSLDGHSHAEDYLSLVAFLRSHANISGGGDISLSASFELKWSQRLIVIANGRGSHFASANGYYNLDMPASGAVITGVGGAADATVTAAGIPIGTWQALYAVLDPAGGASIGVSYRIAGYTAASDIPSNWVLIAVRNSDSLTNRVVLTNGLVLTAGETRAQADGVWTTRHVANPADKSAANTFTAAQRIDKAAHAAGASDYHAELYSPQGTEAGEVSLRFHQGGRWWTQIRARATAFRFTAGSTDALVPIEVAEPTVATHAATKNYVDSTASGGVVPVGAVMAYGSLTVPSGWLACDGTAVSRTTYASLFNVIGTTYGAGDGSTTFNLPSLAAKFPIGAEATNRPIGTSGGSNAHSHGGSGSSGLAGAHGHTASSSSGLAGAHGHTASSSGSSGNAGGHNHSVNVGNSNTYSINRSLGNYSSSHAGAHGHAASIGSIAAHAHTVSVSTSVGNVGDHSHNVGTSVGNVGDHSHNVSVSVGSVTEVPPYQSFQYIIKAT